MVIGYLVVGISWTDGKISSVYRLFVASLFSQVRAMVATDGG